MVLNVAPGKDHRDNSFYGLAIGFTVVAGAVAAGKISGGAFNPAVALGASLMGLFSWSGIWIYLLAELAGGIAAAQAFRYLNPTDRIPRHRSPSDPARSPDPEPLIAIRDAVSSDGTSRPSADPS